MYVIQVNTNESRSMFEKSIVYEIIGGRIDRCSSVTDLWSDILDIYRISMHRVISCSALSTLLFVWMYHRAFGRKTRIGVANSLSRPTCSLARLSFDSRFSNRAVYSILVLFDQWTAGFCIRYENFATFFHISIFFESFIKLEIFIISNINLLIFAVVFIYTICMYNYIIISIFLFI